LENKERGEKMGEGVSYTAFYEKGRVEEFLALKFPMPYPLVFLVKNIHWRKGKSFESEECKMLGSGVHYERRESD
jgi:hypothetical protein